MKALSPIPDAAAWQPPLVALLGLGVSPQNLAPEAMRWLDRAEILVGGRRHLAVFAEHPADKIQLQTPLEQTLKTIDKIATERRTLVLASGDPLFFGIGRRLVELLGKERLHVLPNISAVQHLFARLAEPWEDAVVVSLHGRGGASVDSGPWLQVVREHAKVAIYTDPHNTPGKIAELLLAAGLSDRTLAVGEDLGTPVEKIALFSLEEAKSKGFSPLNVVAVLRPAQCRAALDELAPAVFGIAEEAFEHQAGLITKTEVRAVALASLQLKPDLVLWDLGAGSGSVSIEAARIVRLKSAYAVEKNVARYQDLLENAARLAPGAIVAINEDSLHVLQQLPDPDRVFIGGAGDNLLPILRHCAERLREAGRIVQTIVTLETLQAALSFWRDQPFVVTVTQLQVNRSSPILNTLRLQALNPVFVVTAWRKTRGEGPSPSSRNEHD